MEKIQARVVLEILGRPPEHLTHSLNMLISKLEKEPGIKILEKKIHNPVQVKDSEDLYTSFSELILEMDSIDNYFGIMFAYMPSNIELIYPESLTFKNESFSILGNKLVARLHDYDALAKKMINERAFLLKKLREIAPGLFKNSQNAGGLKEPNKKTKKTKRARNSKSRKYKGS